MIIGKTWANGNVSVKIRDNRLGETWVHTATEFGTHSRLAHSEAQAVGMFLHEIAVNGGSDRDITD